jgi:hypothetical protein
MKAWIDATMQVLYALLANPASTGQLWLTASVAVVVFLVFFSKLSKLFSYPLSSMALSICVLLVTVVACVGLGAVAVYYCGDAPFLKDSALQPWLPLAVVLASLVLIVAPLLRLITGSRYGPSAGGLLLAALAVAITVVLMDAAASALRSGDRDFGRTKDRTQTVNKFLGN